MTAAAAYGPDESHNGRVRAFRSELDRVRENSHSTLSQLKSVRRDVSEGVERIMRDTPEGGTAALPDTSEFKLREARDEEKAEARAAEAHELAAKASDDGNDIITASLAKLKEQAVCRRRHLASLRRTRLDVREKMRRTTPPAPMQPAHLQAKLNRNGGKPD